jgi:hypothetical protein
MEATSMLKLFGDAFRAAIPEWESINLNPTLLDFLLETDGPVTWECDDWKFEANISESESEESYIIVRYTGDELPGNCNAAMVDVAKILGVEISQKG